MVCPKCGNQLADTAKFCTVCGTSVGSEPVATPAETPTPAPVTSEPYFYAPEPVQEATSSEKKGFAFPKKFIKPAIALAIAIVALIAIVCLFKSCSSGEELVNENYVLYMKDGEMFFVDLDGNDYEGIQVGEEYDDFSDSQIRNFTSSYAYLAEDRKTLFYPDEFGSDEFTLFYRDVTDPDSDPIEIDDNVAEYFVSKDAKTVIYIKCKDMNSSYGTLYTYSVKDDKKDKIKSDIYTFYASDDCDVVVFEDDESDLFYVDPTSDDKPIRISRDVEDVRVLLDEEIVLFVKKDKLYKYVIGDEKEEKIASDFSSFVAVYENGECYYTTTPKKEYKYSDFVKGNVVTEDEDDGYYYDDEEWGYSWGDVMDVEVLHYFDGKESTEISEMVIDYSANSDKAEPTVVFAKIDKSDKVKVDSVYSVVETLLKEKATYYIAKETEVIELDLDDVKADTFEISDDGNTIYVVTEYDEEKNYGDLQQITLSGNKVKDITKVESKVVGGTFIDGERFIFYADPKKGKEGEGTTYTLYIDGEEIDSDIVYLEYDEYSDAIYYFTEYDEKNNSWTLNVYKDGKAESVADDVDSKHGYTILPNGKFAYLADYEDGEGTLFVYDGKEAIEIDDGVSELIYIYYGSRSRYAYTWYFTDNH